MKTLYVVAYEYHRDLHDDDLRKLTKRFQEVGTAPGVLAHYTRLDGRGGFLVQEIPDDPARNFEVTIEYGPFMDFNVMPVTTMEDAFPVIQRVYG